jgi:hypothetical protein
MYQHKLTIPMYINTHNAKHFQNVSKVKQFQYLQLAPQENMPSQSLFTQKPSEQGDEVNSEAPITQFFLPSHTPPTLSPTTKTDN